MSLCACVHTRVGKEECGVGTKERVAKRREGRGETHSEDTKFKGTGSKARNPWAMTVSFQSGNRGREFVCL